MKTTSLFLLEYYNQRSINCALLKEDRGWRDVDVFTSEKKARAELSRRVAKASDRKWRIVKRTVTYEVVESFSSRTRVI